MTNLLILAADSAALVCDTVNKLVKIVAPILDSIASQAIAKAVSHNAIASGIWANYSTLIIALMSLGIYEILCRIIPTPKNLSLTSLAADLFNAVLPNFKSGGGTH